MNLHEQINPTCPLCDTPINAQEFLHTIEHSLRNCNHPSLLQLRHERLLHLTQTLIEIGPPKWWEHTAPRWQPSSIHTIITYSSLPASITATLQSLALNHKLNIKHRTHIPFGPRIPAPSPTCDPLHPVALATLTVILTRKHPPAPRHHVVNAMKVAIKQAVLDPNIADILRHTFHLQCNLTANITALSHQFRKHTTMITHHTTPTIIPHTLEYLAKTPNVARALAFIDTTTSTPATALLRALLRPSNTIIIIVAEEG